jgi:hypothetical protein
VYEFIGKIEDIGLDRGLKEFESIQHEGLEYKSGERYGSNGAALYFLSTGKNKCASVMTFKDDKCLKQGFSQ